VALAGTEATLDLAELSPGALVVGVFIVGDYEVRKVRFIILLLREGVISRSLLMGCGSILKPDIMLEDVQSWWREGDPSNGVLRRPYWVMLLVLIPQRNAFQVLAL
jgi:hypothetical protein